MWKVDTFWGLWKGGQIKQHHTLHKALHWNISLVTQPRTAHQEPSKTVNLEMGGGGVFSRNSTADLGSRTHSVCGSAADRQDFDPYGSSWFSFQAPHKLSFSSDSGVHHRETIKYLGFPVALSGWTFKRLKCIFPQINEDSISTPVRQ